MRILGEQKPPQESGTVATSKLKLRPGKHQPPTLTLKHSQNQSADAPAPTPNPKPAKKSSLRTRKP